MTRKHSGLIGGSTAARLLQCPGSWQSIMALPPSADRPSEYAEEGTFAHEVMQRLLQERRVHPDADLIAVSHDLVGREYYDRELTQEHLGDMIHPALEALKTLEDAYGGGFEIVGIEERVAFPGVLAAFGTVDLILRSATHIIVADYKFGSGVPVAALYRDPAGDIVNSQILFYLTAAMNTRPELFKGKPRLIAAILQPRIDNGLSHTEVTRKEVKWFTEDVHEAVMTAQDRDPPLKKGEACRWCPAKINCPLWTAPMLELAANSDKVLPREEMVTADPSPYGQYLARAKNLVEQLAIFKTELDKQLHAYLEDGGAVPGWRLKAKAKQRQWIDESAVYHELEALGFRDEDIWQAPKLQTFSHTDAVAKRLGVEIPSILRQAPATNETTVCRTDDPAPEVTKPLAVEQFRAALADLMSKKTA